MTKMLWFMTIVTCLTVIKKIIEKKMKNGFWFHFLILFVLFRNHTKIYSSFLPRGFVLLIHAVLVRKSVPYEPSTAGRDSPPYSMT